MHCDNLLVYPVMGKALFDLTKPLGKIGHSASAKEDTPESDAGASTRYKMTATVTEHHIYGNEVFHIDKEGPPDHEFENPIYSTEVEYNALADTDSTAHHFVTQQYHYQNLDSGQKSTVYANVDGSERDTELTMDNGHGQLYDYVDEQF